MPLTEGVEFNARLNRYNRLQVPKNVRWRFKMETDQLLHVQVSIEGVLGFPRYFHTKISKEGRITIPKLTMKLLKTRESSLESYIAKVILKPA